MSGGARSGDALQARLGELVRSRRAGGAPRPREEACDDVGRERPDGSAASPGEAPIVPASAAGGTSATRSVAGRSGRGPSARSARDATREVAGVEAFLPGGVWSDGAGEVFVHERLRSDVERRKPHWGRLGEPEDPALAAIAASGLARALFLDLETGGLASSPVFLAGTMHWNGGDFVLRQYFARHYGEEATLVRALADLARGFETLVTFNGKSYDAPFLRARAVLHGVSLDLPPHHVDLLHAARRRWKGVFEDCRLQTLELRVCRRRRAGDVPSDEVPGLYHDYVRSGDPYRLIPVFHHNLLDVITMGEILRVLCEPGRGRGSRGRARGAPPEGAPDPPGALWSEGESARTPDQPDP
jgi:uncharacterized protein YprB with RNaseH-like and TPR domain